ncbi:MAG: anti-sigma factor [Gemmatimonadaceae bacterium]|nr:anti-sigma factor [Gemmatimonadaceae bacterium]
MTARDHLEAAAAYALDAVDAHERAVLDALMTTDAAFRVEVERYREVVGLMGLAAPGLTAPAALRQRILDDAATVRPIATAASAPSPHSLAQRPARRLTAILPWLAAAASLGVAVFNSSQLRDTRSTLATLQGELVTAQDALARKDSTISAFFGPDVHVVSLSSAAQQPSARVYWNHTRRVFIVTAFNVPPAPSGRTYQLWAIAKGKNPMSMGTFNTDASGRATLVVPVNDVVLHGGTIDLCGLTMEPVGGSTQPTEQPRLVGTWRHTD